jgi:hypothetical protein
MIIDVLAIVIIMLATAISIAGAILVSGTTNEDRKKGFKYWQISNICWVATFFMGIFGYISPAVFTIQQSCAFITFLIYFISNYRGARNNGNSR